MGYTARTLVEVISGPAAVIDSDGRVLVANARWAEAAHEGGVHAREGTTFPAPATGCAAHAALLAAVRTLVPGDPPVVLKCRCDVSGERRVQVAMLESDCGAHRRLVTTEPAAPEPGDTDTLGPADHGSVTRAKSKFLALLGHEIRTPVTAVVGMVDLLRALPLQQEVRDVVDGVHRSTHALKALTDDLLDLARLETGRLDLDEGPVRLRRLLESVIEPLQQQVRQKGILLLAALSPSVPAAVMGDPDRLRQVLTNVVGNAVKFTTRGEVVITAARDDDGRLLITVYDTGPGLDEHAQDRLFAPFVQADSSAARRHEGAGLGLAIAARLVARMGGTIDAVSEQGRGSEFHIRLPLVPADGAAEDGRAPLANRRIAVVAPSPRSTQALTWLLTAAGAEAVPASLADVIAKATAVDTVLWCDDSHDPEAPQRAAAVMQAIGPSGRAIMISTTDPRRGLVRTPGVITSPLTLRRLVASVNRERTGVRGAPITVPPLPGGRVLLAEDNEVNRGVFRRMIELLGVECDTAGDGAAAAAAALGDQPYDLVLMDVQMPRTDGLEAARRIRAAGAEVPILALTATALRGDRERCLQAGMNGHLSKPITLPELRRALAPYLCPDVPVDAVAAGPPAPGQVPTAPGTAPSTGPESGPENRARQRRDAAAPGLAAGAVPGAAAGGGTIGGAEATRGAGAAWYGGGPPGAGEPPDAAAANGPDVDLGRLRELERQLADRALVVTTVQTFLSQLDARRAALAGALGRRDRDTLRATAHTLKSSSALLGADPLADACALIERRATAETSDQELATLVAAVERAVPGTVETMASYIAEAGRSG